jgi:putative transposase
MTFNRTKSHRRSIRLKGFDYSEPGHYFVTLCSTQREHLFGNIVDGAMRLSNIGNVVHTCWKAIPVHFDHVNVDTFQIMPNHLHGIINIKDHVPVHKHVEYIQPLPENPSREKPRKRLEYQHVIPKSIGSIIRTFKAAVSRQVHSNHGIIGQPIWQRNYYDHIIRDDVCLFFIQQYIELNPILWHMDFDNPAIHSTTLDVLEKTLKEKYRIKDQALGYIIDRELEYRSWHEQENIRNPMQGENNPSSTFR